MTLARKALVAVAAVQFATAATPALADNHVEALELARANGCTSCHAADKKVVGPAFKAVAERYRGNADAPGALVQKIRMGGNGNWGRMAMPSHPDIPQQDLQKLVGWVLQGAPGL